MQRNITPWFSTKPQSKEDQNIQGNGRVVLHDLMIGTRIKVLGLIMGLDVIQTSNIAHFLVKGVTQHHDPQHEIDFRSVGKRIP